MVTHRSTQDSPRSTMNRYFLLLFLILGGHLHGQDAQPPSVPAFDAFLDACFQEELDRSPIQQGYLGIKKDYHRWDDLSDAAATKNLASTASHLATLRHDYSIDDLNRQQRLSYRLFEDRSERAIATFPWRDYEFHVNQMFGIHSQAPSFLINMHGISSKADALAYITRLNSMPQLMSQVSVMLARQRDLGIVPPKFMFPLVLSDCRNVIRGAPFDDSTEMSTIWQDFQRKVEQIDAISEADKQALLDSAKTALLERVRPAYLDLINAIEAQSEYATSDDGVWRLPRGDAYYSHRLKLITSTNLTADQIHETGLQEVDRIHREMEQIKTQVKFAGTLQEFFRFLRDEDRFYYPNTDEGRERYMREAKAMIDRMRASLDYMFITKPQANMIVKRVEAFREKSAGTAFYLPGTPDGSRPGVYYANLYEMKRMPIYQMEALAFHEGIPGHHMQLSIAQELQGIPRFRRYGRYTAYIEGWGLYCELLPKEFGYYQDPYSDFGRLSMELWRAARLVVDTGLHHKRWSRQRAIDYLIENTPNAEDECTRAINRYLVMPGQATAYKIGMLKILELRSMAQKELGEAFDIRKFHDVILADGAMPLNLLQEQVETWVRQQSSTN